MYFSGGDVILIKYHYYISTSLKYLFCGTKAVTAFDCVNCNRPLCMRHIAAISFNHGIVRFPMTR
jgi:hypothetical protein